MSSSTVVKRLDDRRLRIRSMVSRAMALPLCISLKEGGEGGERRVRGNGGDGEEDLAVCAVMVTLV